jgi:hypothetical protein
MAKITKATLKSFIKNNQPLYINVISSFDGMIDGISEQNDGFIPVKHTDNHIENTLGIEGAWLVHGSRNFFYEYEDENYIGIQTRNCCGNFIIAKRKEK